jgi:antitoxin YefM
MKVISLSQAKAGLSELAEEVDRTHERVLITKQGRDYVVMMSVADLESIEATLELLSDPEAQDRVKQARQEIERGEFLTENEVRGFVSNRRRA